MMTTRKLYLTAEDDDCTNIVLDLQRAGFLDKYKMSFHPDLFQLNRQEILDYVIKNGMGSLLDRVMAQDSILTTRMEAQTIYYIFHQHISYLNNTRKLIITDPYFYCNTENLCETFKEIISPIKNQLESIYIVCNRLTNDESIELVNQQLIHEINPRLKITFKKSESCHDRFWINPENNHGFVVGTSINGIGKKICLIEKISEQDSADILQSLICEGMDFN